MKTTKPLKLHLGAGDQSFEGFVNCDYDPLTKPDFCFDMEKDKWPFEDNSVSEVIAHHVLEHMGEGYFHVIKELYRVCQDGALIDILVPHHRHNYYADDPTHRRSITTAGMWLFSKKYNDECKKQGARASRLGYYFDVDFEVVESQEIPMNEYIPEFEGKKVEDVLKYMSEHSNIIVEVHIKLMVNKK